MDYCGNWVRGFTVSLIVALATMGATAVAQELVIFGDDPVELALDGPYTEAGFATMTDAVGDPLAVGTDWNQENVELIITVDFMYGGNSIYAADMLYHSWLDDPVSNGVAFQEMTEDIFNIYGEVGPYGDPAQYAPFNGFAEEWTLVYTVDGGGTTGRTVNVSEPAGDLAVTLSPPVAQDLYRGDLYTETGFDSVINVASGDEVLDDDLEVTVLFFLGAAEIYRVYELYDGSPLTIGEMISLEMVETVFNIYGDADLTADPVEPDPFNEQLGTWTIQYVVTDALYNNVGDDERYVNVLEPEGLAVTLNPPLTQELTQGDLYTETGFSSVIDIASSNDVLSDDLAVTVLFFLGAAEIYQVYQIYDGSPLTIGTMRDLDVVETVFNVYAEVK